MTVSKPFMYPMYSPYATLRVGAAITVASDDEIFDDLPGAHDQLDIILKNVTFTPGSRDVSAINTLGTTQIRDLKRSDMTTVKFTVVASTLIDTAITGATYDHLIGYIWGDPQVVGATTHYRSQGGWKTSNERALKLLVFRTIAHQTYGGTAYTAEQDICMNNALCTDMEWSHDAESPQEATLTFKCLAADTYVEHDVPA